MNGIGIEGRNFMAMLYTEWLQFFSADYIWRSFTFITAYIERHEEGYHLDIGLLGFGLEIVILKNKND
ncbi:MAG: hypothetical protein ACOC5T_07530 [Elusimicrobiota bacterium]